MPTSRFGPEVIAFSVAAALVASSACGRQDGAPPPTTPTHGGRRVAGGGPQAPVADTRAIPAVIVRERTARHVGDACRYFATITGVLRGHREPSDGARSTVFYAPQVRVDAEVECGRDAPHRARSRTIEGLQFTRATLEQELGLAATVSVDTPGQVCVYWPSVRVEGGSITVHDVREECRRDTD